MRSCLVVLAACALSVTAQFSLSWQKTERGLIPLQCINESLAYAPEGGIGANRAQVYIGRVEHFGHTLPTLVQIYNSTHPAVYVYGEQLYTTTSYDLLCGTGVAWQYMFLPSQHKLSIPPTAYAVGHLANGELVYMCRSNSGGVSVPGMIDPGTKKCVYPGPDMPSLEYYTDVINTDIYEILITV